MWKWIIRRRIRATAQGSAPIPAGETDHAAHVLFAIFARYGDSIIAFKVIAEFIAHSPEKRYTLITTHQARPYAEALLPSSQVRIYSVNKRRNPFGMFRLVRTLRREPPDIGLNPWSHGEESEFFASFARHFYFYRDFADFSREVNLYSRARKYLGIRTPEGTGIAQPVNHSGSIVVAPFSTDLRKSLTGHDLGLLLRAIRNRYNPKNVIIAAMPDEMELARNLGTDHFVFHKNAASSEAYLALLRNTDLFIGVDAGPLHVAMALGLPTIGLFGPTAPETIVDPAHTIPAMRIAELDGVFCDVLSCRDPVCMHNLCLKINFDIATAIVPDKSLRLEKTICRAVSQTPDATTSR